MATLADKLGFGPTRTHKLLPDGNFEITITPPEYSGFSNASVLTLTPEEYKLYLEWLIHPLTLSALFPSWSKEKLEQLQSGITQEDWNKL